MKSLIIGLLAMLCSLGALSAQSLSRQVIGSAGSYQEAGNLKLSATVGEAAYTKVIEGTLTLFQGFQQPDGDDPVNLEDGLPVEVSYQIYPNPTADRLHVKVRTSQPITLRFRLLSVKGQVVPVPPDQLRGSGDLSGSLSLQGLPAGPYLLQITDAQGQVVKHHRILKR
jgi:hypothetical protein